MYLIALMYLNAFKYETELQSMWNGDSNSVLLPQNYVFFLSDCFILGKKGYLLTVPKETEFPKSFFGGSVYWNCISHHHPCITLQFHRNWYLRLQFELKWNLLHQKMASRYWFINIIKVKKLNNLNGFFIIVEWTIFELFITTIE